MSDDDLLLPQGSRLLHIGPHKTGTTALQGALRQAREAMREYGVVYAGRERQHQFAALAVTGGKGMAGDPPATIEHWERLVSQVARQRDGRVIVSSEYFDEADEPTARKVITELGGPKVHVLVTLRPLTKIMPSAWQQYVRNRLRVGYQDWLESMLLKPPYVQPTTTFWKRHHHDVLVERWASVAGQDNVTVVIVDESDRMSLMRLVERFAGLPAGLLEPEKGWTNRSLTYGEIELVRHLNIEFKKRGWSGEMYRTYVRRGMVRHLQAAHQPAPWEMTIRTPDWALDRAAEIGAAAAEKIQATGVRIIGDLSTLGSRPPRRPENDEDAPQAVVPSEAATKAMIGTIVAALSTGALPPASANGAALSQSAGRRAMAGIRGRLRSTRALGRQEQ